jgi:hypothetical protein
MCPYKLIRDTFFVLNIINKNIIVLWKIL